MKYLKYSLYVVFIISLVFINATVSAKTLADLKSELSSAEERYQKNQNEKEQTKEQIQTTKNKITALNKEKLVVQSEIDNLNDELKRLAIDIQNMQKDLKKIINYYQISSTGSIYLEYAFNASSFTDFIYRLAVAEQLSEYRKKTIDKYNGLMEENRNKLNDLAAKQVSLNNLEKQLSAELTNLGNNLSSISEVAIDIKDEIEELKDQVELYESKYKCKLNEEIQLCVDRYNNTGIPSAAGFYRPVIAGRVNANFGYTDHYGSNFHYGIDIGVSHGTAVYPIADGKVVKIYYRNSCGGNIVHVLHKVNGKTYTSQYGHLASIAVREGDIVTKDTVIAYSGGVPWIETWDKCSTGAHLHLQVAPGAYTIDYFWYSDFQARAIDPRTIVNLPAWGQYFSGR